MEDELFIAGLVAIVLVWITLHYVTKWRQAPKITPEDENLLDEMFTLARRLEERVSTVERIAAADHPEWKPGLGAPAADWKSDLAAPATPYRLDRRN